MFRGKKYQESAKLIDKSAQYEAAEGMDLICKTAKAKFDETVEISVRLGVDPRHADQQVRGAVVLPNGTGKNSKNRTSKRYQEKQLRSWTAESSSGIWFFPAVRMTPSG